MTSSRYPKITDELLSAYIDKAVTEEEKALVEAAAANEPTIAWRLETLRQTVALLRTMPSVALPRSFLLTEAQLATATEQTASGNHRTRTPVTSGSPRWAGFWMAWRSFWSVGSPSLRNAAAASFVTLLFLLIGDFFITQPQRLPSSEPSRPAVSVAVMATSQQRAATAATATPAPTLEAVLPQALESDDTSTETFNDPSEEDTSPSPVQQPTPPPSISTMRPPGPDESLEFAPEAAGAASLQGGRESGPMLERMPPEALTSDSREWMTGENTASSQPGAAMIQAATASTNNVTAASQEDESMPAGDTATAVSAQVPPADAESLPLTPSSTSPALPGGPSLASAGAVTTTTASTALSSPEGADLPTSLPLQNSNPAATGAGNSQSGSSTSSGVLPGLQILRFSLAFLTVLFGMLWWRSRLTNSKSV